VTPEKRAAVEALLRDPEWAGRSDSWIGREVGVSSGNVGRLRKALAPESDDEGRPRAYLREGRIMVMRTGRIGPRAAA
jgi:hypothetical protein